MSCTSHFPSPHRGLWCPCGAVPACWCIGQQTVTWKGWELGEVYCYGYGYMYPWKSDMYISFIQSYFSLSDMLWFNITVNCCKKHTCIYIYMYGGFLKWWYSQMDGSWWKIPLKWMIWGYPHLWKPPYIYICIYYDRYYDTYYCTYYYSISYSILVRSWITMGDHTTQYIGDCSNPFYGNSILFGNMMFCDCDLSCNSLLYLWYS